MDIIDRFTKNKWISKEPGNPTKIFICPECGGFIELPQYAWYCYYDYCPYCGNKMREDIAEMTLADAIEIITNAVQRDDMTSEQDKALAIIQKAFEEIE